MDNLRSRQGRASSEGRFHRRVPGGFTACRDTGKGMLVYDRVRETRGVTGSQQGEHGEDDQQETDRSARDTTLAGAIRSTHQHSKFLRVCAAVMLKL